jgi:hypothetical protein
MTTKLRGDSIDAEQIKATVESPGFALITARIHKIHGDRLIALKNEDDEVKLRRTQGFIAAIECIQDIPRILLHEIRTEQKTNG